MVSTIFVSALAASTMLSMASAASSATSASSTVVSIETPSSTPKASEMTAKGCFSSVEPLEDHGSYIFQSPGNCQLICLELEKEVLGLTDGTNCWCGDLLPAADSEVGSENCDTPCSGSDDIKCGGPAMIAVSLTGLTKNRIKNFVPSSSSSGAVSSTKAALSQSTQQQQQAENTVVVTPSGTPPPPPSSGPNKAGIAAGVVVGVVVLAAIIVGVVLFLRHKRRRDVEEEYRRRNVANSFIAGGKLHTSNSSMTDSRLDPEFMNRRASNGSIADNEDYSRRILKVTNA